MSMMEILVSNLSDEHNQTQPTTKIMTLMNLEFLFKCDLVKYTSQFERKRGTEHLEQLQYSELNAVYKKASQIIEDYFGGTEVEEYYNPYQNLPACEPSQNATDQSGPSNQKCDFII